MRTHEYCWQKPHNNDIITSLTSSPKSNWHYAAGTTRNTTQSKAANLPGLEDFQISAHTSVGEGERMEMRVCKLNREESVSERMHFCENYTKSMTHRNLTGKESTAPKNFWFVQTLHRYHAGFLPPRPTLAPPWKELCHPMPKPWKKLCHATWSLNWQSSGRDFHAPSQPSLQLDS